MYREANRIQGRWTQVRLRCEAYRRFLSLEPDPDNAGVGSDSPYTGFRTALREVSGSRVRYFFMQEALL